MAETGEVTVDLKYKNYIFDLYGTLIDIHTDEEDKKLWKALAKYYRQQGRSTLLGNDQSCDILGTQGVGMDTWYLHTNCSPEYTGDVKATYEFL